MPVAFVKHVADSSSTVSGTTLAATVPAAGVAMGNRIVLGFCSNNLSTDASPTCADSKGNVYGVDVEAILGSRRVMIISAPITVALVSGDTITMTSVAAARRGMKVIELSGVSGKEVSAFANDSGSSTPSSGATPARATAASILVGFCGWNHTGTGDSFLAGTGYTLAGPLVEAFSGTNARYLHGEYRVMAATGTEGADGSLENAGLPASRAWSMLVAAYPETPVVVGSNFRTHITRLNQAVNRRSRW